jgi:hypothetical protein
MADDAAAEQARRLEAAAPLLSEAERRLRMGRVLLSNGFEADALAPLTTACDTLIQAAVTLALGETSATTPMTDAMLEAALAPRGPLPADTPDLLARLRTANATTEETALAGLFTEAEHLLATVRGK